jgi:diadenylate cyclase
MIERFSAAMHLQDLSLWALVDVFILAVLIYQLLLMIRGTRAVNMLLALAAVALLYVMTGPGLIELNALHSILGNLLFYLPLIVIVLFQTQIRQALAQLGKNPLSSLIPKRTDENLIEEVTLAAAALASKRIGALIVVERGMGLRTFSETGIALDSLISYDLLMNLFTRRSPLHDGAVIIAEGRIKAASCYLPLTTNPSLSRVYGTRHRAAVGITEESDAVAIVVSEERGVVSLAENGKISAALDSQGLETLLFHLLGGGTGERNDKETGRTGVVAEGQGDA